MRVCACGTLRRLQLPGAGVESPFSREILRRETGDVDKAVKLFRAWTPPAEFQLRGVPVRSPHLREDRDEIAQLLLRNGDGWADVIDTGTMYRTLAARCAATGEIDAAICGSPGGTQEPTNDGLKADPLHA